MLLMEAVLAAVAGDAWRWAVTVIVLVVLVAVWYFMMDKLGTF